MLMRMGIQENHPQQRPTLGLPPGMGTSMGMPKLPKQADEPFSSFAAGLLPSELDSGGSLIQHEPFLLARKPGCTYARLSEDPTVGLVSFG